LAGVTPPVASRAAEARRKLATVSQNGRGQVRSNERTSAHLIEPSTRAGTVGSEHRIGNGGGGATGATAASARDDGARGKQGESVQQLTAVTRGWSERPGRSTMRGSTGGGGGEIRQPGGAWFCSFSRAVAGTGTPRRGSYIPETFSPGSSHGLQPRTGTKGQPFRRPKFRAGVETFSPGWWLQPGLKVSFN
jgi:hypothetical protein